MAERGNPTIRRRLADQLRYLRERAGFTAGEVADQLGWSGSKISRMELAQVGVKSEDLESLLGLYGIGDPLRGELLALAKESHRSGRIPSVQAARMPDAYAELLHAEDEAESVWVWASQLVPGLLQTEDYARAVMLGWHSMFTEPPEEIDRRIVARELRQEVLYREPPLQLSFVLDESILLRKLDSARVMHQQVERLIQMSHLPNVILQILPLSGVHHISSSNFAYMRFPQVHEIPLSDLVTFEHLNGTEREQNQENIFRYNVVFRALTENSLSPEESRELMTRVAQDGWP